LPSRASLQLSEDIYLDRPMSYFLSTSYTHKECCKLGSFSMKGIILGTATAISLLLLGPNTAFANSRLDNSTIQPASTSEGQSFENAIPEINSASEPSQSGTVQNRVPGDDHIPGVRGPIIVAPPRPNPPIEEDPYNGHHLNEQIQMNEQIQRISR